MKTVNRRAFLISSGAALGMQAQPARKPLRLGVIAAGRNPDEAIGRVKEFGFTCCQLHQGTFDLASAPAVRAALDKHQIEATALIVTGPGPEVYNFTKGPSTIGLLPREFRAARIARMKEAADFAKALAIPGIQGHCGFMPEDPNDAGFAEVVAALKDVVGYCRERGLTFRCETGQETPIALLRVIRAVGLDNLGVNFDCGNLVLYGKANPVDALDTLGPLILGVHAKDGLYPVDPNKLGEEVAIGKGKVDFPRFIARLKAVGYRGPITIEREISGPRQAEDIRASKQFLENLIG